MDTKVLILEVEDSHGTNLVMEEMSLIYLVNFSEAAKEEVVAWVMFFHNFLVEVKEDLTIVVMT